MSQPTPPSVRQWLSGLGLEQYADAFESQAIEPDLLPSLSDAEFDQLGVRLLGHRLKLARAVAALGGAAPPPAARQDAAGSNASAAAPQQRAPERRQLTVMFCDLVGSTALSQELDPEDLRSLMQRYQRICAAAVDRRDGHVAQYLGDGIMVYFGWPRAHEDDAQRALHTALEIVDAIKVIASDRTLRVRIGIATGAVVVGETGGGDASLPKTAIGETPNVAARVQALAQPDEVLIAATTRRLVADAFDCEDRGEQALKGIAQKVKVWRVLGPGRAAGRFEAAHGARLTPLVNRDEEMGLLLDRWSRALKGRGQGVLLVGEPGIGKSRITAELAAQAGDGSVLMQMQCSELHDNSAFYPVVTSLQRAAGFERDDAPQTRVDKLESFVQRLGVPLEGVASALADLLSLPRDRYPLLQASAAKRRRDIVDALVTIVIEASRKSPVLLIAEDLHWMDPTTMEVIDALLAAIADAPVLMVMTSRKPLAERWQEHEHLTRNRLFGLNRSHSLKLAVAVALKHGLPERLLQRIVERTDGVPLFLEEVTRTLLERKAPHATGVEGAGAQEAIEIPATLKDSLTARLDQLGAAKRCAQLGAIFGRQFRRDATLALSGMSEGAFATQMESLLAAGLLTRTGEGAGSVYTFHHALIQDAAYETLLKSDRRSLHARAGAVLTELFPELTETEPEVLARHYTDGEIHDKAVALWLKAGQGAWLRSATHEAIAHLSAGLAQIAMIEDAALRDGLELRLQSALGVVFFAAVSYAAPQARSAFERAAALCERVPETSLKVPVLYGMGAFQTMKGDIRAGHEAFTKLMAEAYASAQPRLQMYSHSVLAWSHHNCAQYAQSVQAAERTSALYASGAMAGPRLSAADPLIISECFRAASLWSQGLVDQARAASDDVLAHARSLSEPYSLAYTLNFASLIVPELCGDHELVLQRTGEGISLARELGYPFLEVFGTLWRSWVQGQAGDAAAAQAALETMDEALQRCQALGVRYRYGQLLARRARLLLRTGQAGAAQLEIAQAVAQVEASGEQSIQADVYTAEGEVHAAAGGEQQALAEAAFTLALEVAREQRALSWELRAATGLARLWSRGGRSGHARELLQPVLVRFTEGRDTADVREATALLATLD